MLEGVGVYLGLEVSVIFFFVEVGMGIVFYCMYENGDVIELKVVLLQVGNIDFCIMFGFLFVIFVVMIEYLMVVFYVMGVDNVVIQVIGVEILVMDGSFVLFIEVMEFVGMQMFGVKCCYICVVKFVCIEVGNCWSEFVLYDGM